MSWETLKLEPNHEICTEEPYMIRHITTQVRVTERVNHKTGVIMMRINGNNYCKHRLIAGQWLDNPMNYPCVRHIDGNKRNNSLQNLQWCSENQIANHKLYQDECVDTLPDEHIAVTHFNGNDYDDLYYHDNQFYKYNGINYRKLRIHKDRYGNFSTVATPKDQRVGVNISYKKFKKEYNIQ